MIWWEIANTIRLLYHSSAETIRAPVPAHPEQGTFLLFLKTAPCSVSNGHWRNEEWCPTHPQILAPPLSWQWKEAQTPMWAMFSTPGTIFLLFCFVFLKVSPPISNPTNSGLESRRQRDLPKDKKGWTWFLQHPHLPSHGEEHPKHFLPAVPSFGTLSNFLFSQQFSVLLN